MTNFIFVRLRLSYTSFSYFNLPENENKKTGLNQNNTGIVELQRGGSQPLFSDFDDLFTAFRLLNPNPNPGFMLTSITSFLNNCITLQIQIPTIIYRFVFSVSRSVVCVRNSVLNCEKFLCGMS